jgi:hypothetical protein
MQGWAFMISPFFDGIVFQFRFYSSSNAGKTAKALHQICARSDDGATFDRYPVQESKLVTIDPLA